MNKVLLSILVFITIKGLGQVNLPSGSAEFSLPVFNWQDGKSRLNTFVSVNYSSGSGLKVNSVASNIGQGWSMIAGGMITRIQAGEPDDQKPYYGNGTSEDITKYPAGYLYDTSTTAGYSNQITRYPLYKDKNHIYKQHNVTVADKQMDQFAFQFNGRSGLFVLGRSRTSNDAAFLGDGKLKLWYDIDESMTQQGIRTTITAFHIRDDNGLIYTFSKKETVKVLKTVYTDKNGVGKLAQPNFKNGKVYYEKSVEGSSNEIKNPLVVMAWYLDKIEDPLTGRLVRFYYHTNSIEADAGASLSFYKSKHDYSIVTRSVSYSQTPQLDSIVMPDGHCIQLTYGANRIDMNGDKVFSSIAVKYKGRYLSKYLFKTAYVIRNRYGNPISEFQRSSARLFLMSITKVSTDLKAEEKPYTFDYYLGSGDPYDFVPPPFYHLKDIWGYYNGSNSRNASNQLINPDKTISNLNNEEIKGLCFLRGSGSNPVLNARDGMAKNGLLRQINFPQGGSLNYEYEQNKAMLSNQMQLVGGVHVSKVTTTDGGYSNACNNPIATLYKYTLANGTQSSFWGVENPVNSMTLTNYYKPEKKRFKVLKCDHDFKYPGIISRDNVIPLNNWQKAMVIVANITDAIAPYLQILDIIMVASGSTGPAALIIDAIVTVVNIVLTCFVNPAKTSSLTIFYNNDLNASNPLPMQFKRVEVTQGNGSIGKTIHEFTSSDDYPVWFSTNPVYSMRQRYAYWAYGLPKRVAIYDATGNILNETIHYYDTTYARRRITGCKTGAASRQMQQMATPCDSSRYTGYKNLILKNSSQRSDDWDSPIYYNSQNYTTDMTSNPDMKVQGYFVFTGRVQLQKTVNRIYKKGLVNQYAQSVTEYSYNSADCSTCDYQNYEVNEVKNMQSNGDIQYQTFRYDHPYLYSNSIFMVPFQTTISFQKSGSNTRYYTAEIATEFKYAPNGNVVPWKIKSQRFEVPKPASQMHFYTTIDDPNPGYKVTKEFFYDNNSNLIGQKDEGSRAVTHIYDYDDQYVSATIIGVDPVTDKVSYTSFETDDFSRSGWSFTGTPLYSNTGVTGNRSMILSSGKSLSAQLNTGKPYLLSFWAMAGMNVSAGATLAKSAPTLNGFTYYEYKIAPGTSTVSITGAGNIDEVRLYPAHTRMQTVAYDPLLGKISDCDQNNRINYYEYDDLGRIRFIRDENKNVVKMHEYNEKIQHSNCPTFFENVAISEVFVKNDCATGFIGSEVVYTIPAGKYTSSVSREEVDMLVEKELMDMGQSYANSNGICKQIFTNDAISETFSKEGCADGYKGTSVTYSVPAGKYTSTVSKADANEMAQDEIESNGQSFANAPGNAACIVDYEPFFVGEEDAPAQCQKSGGINTGHVLVLLTDKNPNSPSYNQTMWVDEGENLDACPIPPCTGCTGQAKKCINGICETGIKVYTYSECVDPGMGGLESKRDTTSQKGAGTMHPMYNGQCKMTYHYEWSDGSWSQSYIEYGAGCALGGTGCPYPID